MRIQFTLISLLFIIIFSISPGRNSAYSEAMVTTYFIFMIYVWVGKRIIKKQDAAIYFYKAEDMGKLVGEGKRLGSSDEQALLALLSRRYMHIHINRALRYEPTAIVVHEGKKKTKLYFGWDDEGDPILKINRGFFFVSDLQNEDAEKCMEIINKYNVK